MKTYIQDLVNSPTLAPIKQNCKLENLSERETQILASISASNITAIESLVSTLTHITNNLEMYKQAMIDCTNLLAETINSNKKKDTIIPFQCPNLPGIISLPKPRDVEYDLEKINVLNEKALRQKRIFFRIIQKECKLLFQSIKGLELNDSTFEEFIEILHDRINLILQPTRLVEKPSQIKSSIKVSVDPKLIK